VFWSLVCGRVDSHADQTNVELMLSRMAAGLLPLLHTRPGKGLAGATSIGASFPQASSGTTRDA
jgi:hypothetical protein